MMDFWSSITAMTQEYEAHGKTWILIDSINQAADKSGYYWLAVEKGVECPAPVQIVFKANLSNV